MVFLLVLEDKGQSLTVRHVGQNRLDELFKLFRKVELAEQTRFSSEMAYEQRILHRETLKTTKTMTTTMGVQTKMADSHGGDRNGNVNQIDNYFVKQ